MNEDGVVVGIDDAYIPPQQGAVAIGFATPAPTVAYVVEQLISMKPGDVIVGLGGKKIADVAGLLAALRERRPGDTVQVTIVRNGNRRQVSVTLTGRSSG